MKGKREGEDGRERGRKIEREREKGLKPSGRTPPLLRLLRLSAVVSGVVGRRSFSLSRLAVLSARR